MRTGLQCVLYKTGTVNQLKSPAFAAVIFRGSPREAASQPLASKDDSREGGFDHFVKAKR
jgi:hypothetical protein